MNYVQQAFELEDAKKEMAKHLYKQAVKKIANKNYVSEVDDAHTELSSLFGVSWLINNRRNVFFWVDSALYAEANIAFNYANFRLGARGKFVALAMELVEDKERISYSRLLKMGDEMNCILTATTEESISENLSTIK